MPYPCISPKPAHGGGNCHFFSEWAVYATWACYMDIRALYTTKPPKCALTCQGDPAADRKLPRTRACCIKPRPGDSQVAGCCHCHAHATWRVDVHVQKPQKRAGSWGVAKCSGSGIAQDTKHTKHPTPHIQDTKPKAPRPRCFCFMHSVTPVGLRLPAGCLRFCLYSFAGRKVIKVAGTIF